VLIWFRIAGAQLMMSRQAQGFIVLMWFRVRRTLAHDASSKGHRGLEIRTTC
jgi:hypothetical protein